MPVGCFVNLMARVIGSKRNHNQCLYTLVTKFTKFGVDRAHALRDRGQDKGTYCDFSVHYLQLLILYH